MKDASPVNPLPPVVVIVFLILAGIEAAVSLGATGMVGGAEAVGWRIGLIERFAFAPRVQELILQGRGSADLALRYLSYPLIHGSFTHAVFTIALWLALGKYVGELFRPVGLLAIAAVATIAGAICYGVVSGLTGAQAPLYGAYPPVYGLIGAYTYLMWLRLGQLGENQLRAFTLIGVLLGLQLVFGALLGVDPTWPAEIGGFVFGGITAVLVAPGGWASFVQRVRRR